MRVCKQLYKIKQEGSADLDEAGKFLEYAAERPDPTGCVLTEGHAPEASKLMVETLR